MRLDARVVSGLAVALFLISFFALSPAIAVSPTNGAIQPAGEPQVAEASHTHEGGIEALCAWRTHDPCAPHIEVTLPKGGEVFRGVERIEWTAIDFEGEQLVYDVYFSSDGGATWTTLASGLTTLAYSWDTTQVSDGDSYLIRVDVLGSGVASGRDQSNSVFTVDNLADDSPMQETLDPFTLVLAAGIIGMVVVAGVALLARKNNQ